MCTGTGPHGPGAKRRPARRGPVPAVGDEGGAAAGRHPAAGGGGRPGLAENPCEGGGVPFLCFLFFFSFAVDDVASTLSRSSLPSPGADAAAVAALRQAAGRWLRRWELPAERDALRAESAAFCAAAAEAVARLPAPLLCTVVESLATMSHSGQPRCVDQLGGGAGTVSL